MIISPDTKKAFDTIQHHFVIKALRKLGPEENVLNMIQGIFERLSANTTINGERHKIRKRTRVPILPLLFNIVRKVLIRAIIQKHNKQVNKIKAI